ncbi:uncharacterized protein LOC103311860 isoform X2 [Acyrthosiphon pisum]|uniref:TGF-beta propeptide domain-containing protein n=1 Tax=Acyrthosiphon pisum TaxID=7029 RepID=A0A8R2BBM0_ACYPI|nr:uncharacterized protein LOC103311860 isoform X2 [Acyrthosiphon pisum]|eukprot:XP_008189870.1 PREDICTED: uncharacterized protein LOC103311860 isoform X2 [Acyrthosiphon pisum]
MMTLTPRLLVAVVLLWAVTVAVQSRPATDSGESEIEESVELSPNPSVVMVPVRQLMDPNSPFARILNNQLLKMSERDLQAIETGLTGTKTKPVSSGDPEMMMGDMPSEDDSQDSSSPATMFERATVMTDRESPEYEDPEVRARQQRIEDIQRQMINLTGRKSIIPPIPVKKTGPISSYPSDTFIEKTQSFYPICEMPKHTNGDSWNTKELMNLMFNISLPKSSNGISVNVNTARLRLYKQFVSCYSQTSNETDDSQSCQPTLFVTKKQSNLTNASVVPIIMDERLIRVSIYLNIRSLKRKRVIKRKLLDSRMVPYFSEKWTEWNIRNAAKAWHKNPARNYGISIEVEDEDGNFLPVAKFFRPINCSEDAQMMTPKPMPGFLMEAVHSNYGVLVRNPTTTANNSNTNAEDALALSFNMYMYPMMDVTTVEVPESEANNAMFYLYAKNTLEQVGGRSSGLSQGQEYMIAEFQHRIRHGIQHRNNGTIPGSLSKDGHELRDQIIPQSIIQWNVQHKSTTTETPD